LHIKLCSNKKAAYHTYISNFVTSRLIIKILQTGLWVGDISSWLRTTSLTRSTFSSVRALCGLPLSVSVDCASGSGLCQQPVNTTFYLLFVRKFICFTPKQKWS